jgi:hypothetical protein
VSRLRVTNLCLILDGVMGMLLLFERYHLFIGIGIVARYSNEIILFTEATPVQMITDVHSRYRRRRLGFTLVQLPPRS